MQVPGIIWLSELSSSRNRASYASAMQKQGYWAFFRVQIAPGVFWFCFVKLSRAAKKAF